LELELPLERIGSIGRCRSSNTLCALETSNQIFWKLDIVIGSFQWKLPILPKPKLVILQILLFIVGTYHIFDNLFFDFFSFFNNEKK